MKGYFWIVCLLFSLGVLAQDTTINNLMKDMSSTGEEKKEAVKIFSSVKAINANTTEMIGKGKMDFRITHNFDDIDGKGGVFGRFLGLDNVRDVRIGFQLGLSDRVNIHIARDKGAGAVNKIYELGLKFKLAEQLKDDPSHPVAIALFVNAAVATAKAQRLDGFENSYRGFSDRMSEVIQLIIARKFGRVSLQLNPTFVHTNYVRQHDDQNMFALGGAIRFPVTRNFNIIIDYFHPFRSQTSKDYFNSVDNTYNPPSDVNFNPAPFKFYDPLGISFEFLTPGHVFNLNFTNSTEILENRFIPRTINSFSHGQWRWGFTISRMFSLWREKN